MSKATADKEILKNKLHKLYVEEGNSIPDVSLILNKSRSAVRYWLNKFNFLRSRTEGIRSSRHKLGKHRLGKKFMFTESHKLKIKESALERSENKAKGYRINTNGYYEITKGFNKGMSIHVIIAESIKGRKLKPNEVAHHIDENKLNNSPDNLQVMTNSEHARLHAIKNYPKRNINKKGQFT